MVDDEIAATKTRCGLVCRGQIGKMNAVAHPTEPNVAIKKRHLMADLRVAQIAGRCDRQPTVLPLRPFSLISQQPVPAALPITSWLYDAPVPSSTTQRRGGHAPFPPNGASVDDRSIFPRWPRTQLAHQMLAMATDATRAPNVATLQRRPHLSAMVTDECCAPNGRDGGKRRAPSIWRQRLESQWLFPVAAVARGRVQA